MAFLGMIKKSASFFGSPSIFEMRSSSLATLMSLEPFGGVEGDGGLWPRSGAKPYSGSQFRALMYSDILEIGLSSTC